MKTLRFLIAAFLLAGFAPMSWAAESGQKAYDPHHPEDAASTPKAKAPTAKPAAPKPSASRPSAATKQNLDRMDGQMMMMGEMHQKMMNAKTPEERGALMGEHMKVMQDSMSMMNMMSGSAMGGMGAGGKGGSGMGGMQGDRGTIGSMEDRQQMMEKRMDMMQMMMQMMMDSQAAPATP